MSIVPSAVSLCSQQGSQAPFCRPPLEESSDSFGFIAYRIIFTSLKSNIFDLHSSPMPRRTLTLSGTASIALRLLGTQIRAGRVRRRWTEAQLAERLGISRPTLRRIETGEPTVTIGAAFEACAVLGIPLFDLDTPPELSNALDRTRNDRALLPRRVRARRNELTIDDDF